MFPAVICSNYSYDHRHIRTCAAMNLNSNDVVCCSTAVQTEGSIRIYSSIKVLVLFIGSLSVSSTHLTCVVVLYVSPFLPSHLHW